MQKSTSKPRDKSTEAGTQRSAIIPLLIFCVAALYVSSLVYNYGFSSYDDGTAAEGARLILQGKIPYRDFWTMYSPGASYINAVAMALLGESMVSLRIFALFCGILQSALFYIILQKLVSGTIARLMGAAIYVALIPIGVGALWFTVVLAAAFCIIRYFETRCSKWCYFIGLFAGMTYLFRQDSGAYFLLAALPLVCLATPEPGLKRSLPVIRVAGVFAVVLLAIVGYFAAHGALAQLWECTVRFPVVDFPASRQLPYPMPWNKALVIGQYSAPFSVSFPYHLFGFYLLPLMLVVSTAFSIRSYVRSSDRNWFVIAALFTVALALFLMVRVRPSGARIVASAALSMLAFAALIPNRSRLVRSLSIAILVVSLVSFVPFSVYTVWAHRTYAQSLIPGKSGLYAAKGHAELLAAVSEYVKRQTSPSEKIFSGSPAVYFLAGRDPATVYFEPHPCVTDRLDIQKIIIRDMEAHHVRYFVRSSEWGMNAYFTIEPEHQPKALIDYIETRYQPTADFMIFRVYERKTPFAGKH